MRAGLRRYELWRPQVGSQPLSPLVGTHSFTEGRQRRLLLVSSRLRRFHGWVILEVTLLRFFHKTFNYWYLYHRGKLSSCLLKQLFSSVFSEPLNRCDFILEHESWFSYLFTNVLDFVELRFKFSDLFVVEMLDRWSLFHHLEVLFLLLKSVYKQCTNICHLRFYILLRPLLNSFFMLNLLNLASRFV